MRCLRASCFLVSVSLPIFSCTGQERFDIIDSKCGSCHTADIVYSEARTKTEWDILLNGMKIRGLKITPAEEKQIKEILYNKLGK